MAGRIVVFGATGYTGELTARALVERGAMPLLAGRDADRVARLAAELGGLESTVADVDRSGSVRALVERGDVLVTTVGPYLRFGEPALEAAVDAGAHYFDSTGEGPFIRRVFDEYGARAQRADCALLTAFGYDFVPGNLAGALALREAADSGRRATCVEIFYVTTGGGPSGGTMASGVSVMLRPGFAFRGGRLTGERQGARVAAYQWGARSGAGISISGSEHYSLPRLHRELRDVGVYLGVPGAQTWQVQAASAAMTPAQMIEPLGRMVEAPGRWWGAARRAVRAKALVATPALACWLEPSTSRATAWPRYASRAAIPTSSPRQSWRGGRHGPPKVSSRPAGRWDPPRRSTSTISTVAPKTPACGPCDRVSSRRWMTRRPSVTRRVNRMPAGGPGDQRLVPRSVESVIRNVRG